jgi:hypothetical protein
MVSRSTRIAARMGLLWHVRGGGGSHVFFKYREIHSSPFVV